KPRGANLGVDVQPGAEYRRVPDAPRNLPRQPARRRNTAYLAARVDAIAIDRPIQMLWIDQALGRHLASHSVAGFHSVFRIQVVQRVGSALPFEPEFS